MALSLLKQEQSTKRSIRAKRLKAGWDEVPHVRPPTSTNMAHLHFGTGWWKCSVRGTLEILRFYRAIPLIHQVGFQGLCTHGE